MLEQYELPPMLSCIMVVLACAIQIRSDHPHLGEARYKVGLSGTCRTLPLDVVGNKRYTAAVLFCVHVLRQIDRYSAESSLLERLDRWRQPFQGPRTVYASLAAGRLHARMVTLRVPT